MACKAGTRRTKRERDMGRKRKRKEEREKVGGFKKEKEFCTGNTTLGLSLLQLVKKDSVRSLPLFTIA